MAVLLIDAFSIVILNLALLAVAFIMILLGIPLIVAFTGSTFVCGTSLQYCGLRYFLAILLLLYSLKVL